MKLLASIVLSLLLSGVATAQTSELKTFKMFVPITEQFVGCLTREDTVEIAVALTKGDQSVGIKKFQEDLCRQVEWTITYVELVYSAVGRNGERITVYRGQVNGVDIFVPMIGWTHEVI